MQDLVVSTINSVIKALLKKCKFSADDISHLTLAANTTMTHLFLGLDPKHIRSGALCAHLMRHSAGAGPGSGD